MTPPVTSMGEKVASIPQVEQAGPPARPRRRGVWVAVGVVLAALVLGGAVLGAVAIYNNAKSQRHEQNFELGVAYPERRVPEHVTVDYKKQIIYVNEERYGTLGGLHHLHHFGRWLTAIRDLVNNRCYVAPQHSDFKKTLDWLTGNNGTTLQPTVTGFRLVLHPIDSDVLQSFGGEEIANHCGDLPAHWIIPNSQEPSGPPNSNKTVEFQCSNGGEFDFQTSTCGPSQASTGHREKRWEVELKVRVLFVTVTITVRG